MRTYTVSIANFEIKVRRIRAHVSGQKAQPITKELKRRSLQAAKSTALAISARVLNSFNEPTEAPITYKEHNLFCEGHCCNKPFSEFHSFLENSIRWRRDGHIDLR